MTQNEFEDIVIEKLLSGDQPDLVTLRQQYAQVKARTREKNGNWIFVRFSVPDDVPLTKIREIGFCDVTFRLPSDSVPGQAFVVAKDGRLAYLQMCHSNWPTDPGLFKVDHLGRESRDPEYVKRVFSIHSDIQAGCHLLATGSHGEYKWLTTGHDLVEFLEICPEVVIGKYLAVTALDSGILRLNTDEIGEGWQSRAGIGYSPKVQSIKKLPHLNHPERCREYHEWYVFESPAELGSRSDEHPMIGMIQPEKVMVFVNFGPRLHDTYCADVVARFWEQFDLIRPHSYIADSASCLIYVCRDPGLFSEVCEKLR